MKTLYKRLKPKVKKAVDDKVKKYPTVWSPLVTELKLVRFVEDLSVGSAVKIYDVYYPIKPFRIMEYYELFNDWIMEANELRIGNTVNYDSKQVSISWEDLREIALNPIRYKKLYTPIPK